MKHATRSGGTADGGPALLHRIAPGGLLVVGLLALVGLVSGSLRYDSMSFADTGVLGETAPNEFAAPAPVTPAPQRGLLAASAEAAGVVVTLSSEMQRVRDYVARRYRVSSVALEPVLAAAESNGRSAGIDPLLIVAVMAVESSFNPFAESHMGARGLMQVIPRFHMDKIGEGRDEDALFDPLLNVQVGTLVLVEGLKRFGSLQTALQYYGGALNDPEATYANKVLALKQRLVSAAGRSTGADA